MAARVSDRTSLCLSAIITAVLVLLPFHAFFTTWIGSHTGHLDALRIWKELVIVALVPASAWLALRDKTLKSWFARNWLPRLIGAYALLQLSLGVLALQAGRVNSSALIYGLLANLRFLGFFLVVYAASNQSDYLKRHWKLIVAVPAAIVIIFGLLQRLVLPYDFLRHFGYGPKTIPAYQTVDNKLGYQRIQSTLRGANPFGAYLIVIVPLLATLKRRKLAAGLLLAALIALFFSYSRSAYIGVALAGAAYGYLSIPSAKLRRQLVGLIIVLFAVTGLTVAMLRHNTIVQNTVFHTDNTSRSTESSNTGRARALEDGLREVAHEPFGRGPGTAGPASVRNDQPARIAENYYLQIGQETGWFGIILFVTITGMVGYELWKRRADSLCRALLAALIGISFVNLLSHAWADDTLALMWWGLASVALTSVILNEKRKHNVQTKKAAKARS